MGIGSETPPITERFVTALHKPTLLRIPRTLLKTKSLCWLSWESTSRLSVEGAIHLKEKLFESGSHETERTSARQAPVEQSED
jgi:hypothetical protein